MKQAWSRNYHQVALPILSGSNQIKKVVKSENGREQISDVRKFTEKSGNRGSCGGTEVRDNNMEECSRTQVISTWADKRVQQVPRLEERYICWLGDVLANGYLL